MQSVVVDSRAGRQIDRELARVVRSRRQTTLLATEIQGGEEAAEKAIDKTTGGTL